MNQLRKRGQNNVVEVSGSVLELSSAICHLFLSAALHIKFFESVLCCCDNARRFDERCFQLA